jgi:hypothetical protein
MSPTDPRRKTPSPRPHPAPTMTGKRPMRHPSFPPSSATSSGSASRKRARRATSAASNCSRSGRASFDAPAFPSPTAGASIRSPAFRSRLHCRSAPKARPSSSRPNSRTRSPSSASRRRCPQGFPKGSRSSRQIACPRSAPFFPTSTSSANTGSSPMPASLPFRGPTKPPWSAQGTRSSLPTSSRSYWKRRGNAPRSTCGSS